MTSKIRKQVYDLTLDDLETSAAWEFALDEEGEENQDEATVRPYYFTDNIDPSDGMFIVKAQFTLSDESVLFGYLTPAVGDNSPGLLQPQIITKNAQVGFWCGRCAPDRDRAYELLEREPTNIFPIRFESCVPLVGGTILGTIPGFLCLGDDFTTVTIVQ